MNRCDEITVPLIRIRMYYYPAGFPTSVLESELVYLKILHFFVELIS